MDKRATIREQAESILESAKQLISESRHEEAVKKIAEIDTIGKYGSELRSIFNENLPSKPCEVCGNEISAAGFAIHRREYYFHCKFCADNLQKSENEENEKKFYGDLAERLEVFLSARGVPKRFVSAQMSDFPSSMKKYSSTDRGLFISGSRGVGKTHLAVALMREMILNLKPNKLKTYRRDEGHFVLDVVRPEVETELMPKFKTIPDLLLEIRSCFDKQRREWSSEGGAQTEKGLIDQYANYKVLILDDLGVEKTSDWSMQTLYTLIDRRYREMMRTIITSNLTLDQLAEKLDDRISSRIAGMCDIQVLKGKDRRIQ
jgi:DNA replication protein DnaC